MAHRLGLLSFDGLSSLVLCLPVAKKKANGKHVSFLYMDACLRKRDAKREVKRER